MDAKQIFDLVAGTGISTAVGGYLVKKGYKAWKRLVVITSLSEKVELQQIEIEALKKEMFITRSKKMAILHTLPLPVFIVNLKGELIYANPAWFSYTGFESEEYAYGKNFMKAVPKEDVAEMREISKELEQHPVAWSGQIRLQHIKTKVITTFFCRSEPYQDDVDSVVETLGILQPIN